MRKAFLILLLFNCSAFGANTFTQGVTVITVSVPTNSPTATYGANCTAGTTLVLTVTEDAGVFPTLTSVTDPTNGAWTVNGSVGNGYATPGAAYIASVHNTGTTALTVSLTFTGGGGIIGEIALYEITGPPSSSFVADIQTANNQTNPSITLTATANDTIIAAMSSYSNGGWVADTSYTLDYGPDFHAVFYGAGESIADAGGAGSKTLTWGGYTAASSGYPAFAAIAIKANGGGGGGTKPCLRLLLGVGSCE
jgi:hypothetical protein